MPDRKPRVGFEVLCELVFRPAAHVVARALLPLRVPPPAVVLAGAATGIAAAVEVGRGAYVAAALLLQLKTVLDNADGQLARLTGRTSAFGRYLDSELDLLVNAALFAALGWATGRPAAALAGFLALTAVLSVNFNAERLGRGELDAVPAAMPDGGGRPTALLRAVYGLVYAPQDRLVEAYAERRLRGRAPAERLAWHDAASVTALANLGMSTQLAALGVCLVAGQPLAFAWLALAELAFVVMLALRRESRLRAVLP
ncbi:MAG: CDP-alcohol phosphatidyltransferase family protein, partial [Gaiellaceae bacterium]